MEKRLSGIKSKYKGVSYYYSCNKSSHWALSCCVAGYKTFKLFPFNEEGERDAAIAYDIIRINNDKAPVNILKKKDAKRRVNI